MRKDKGRLTPFVPVLHATLDTPAWRALSHPARSLYISLKRRVPKGRNTAYLSYRDAAAEMSCSKTTVALRYQELQHFGFIVLDRHGCLGVNGKGQSPRWRLTELGQTSRTSSNGLFEAPTNNFLRWDGTPFSPRPKNKTPSTREGQGVHPWRTVVSTREGHLKAKVSTHEGQSDGSKCPPVRDKTSKPLPSFSH